MIMPPALRKFALAVHLTVSIGWIGAVAAYTALDVSTVTGSDVGRLRAAYSGMELIADNVIAPLAVASLLTGIVMSAWTKWGLLRHWWVVISLLLTTVAAVVLLSETRTIGYLARRAADPATTAAQLRALESTLVHSIGGAIVLLVILVLNLYKPQGLTPYGWRKQEEAADGNGWRS